MACARFIRRAEYGDRRHAERRGDVHRARIVGQEKLATGRQFDELREGCLAGIVHDVVAVQPCDLLTNGRSLPDPNRAMEAPQASANVAAASAKRSGSQRFAFP